MTSPRKKIVHKWLYLGYASGALFVYLLLMVFVLPWWHASSQPVLLTLGAGSGEEILLEYSPDEAALPLVPVGDVSGYSWKWATELPPRPSYDLALLFPGGSTGGIVYRKIEVIRLTPTKDIACLEADSLTGEGADGIRLKETQDGARVFSEPGGRLPIPVDLSRPTSYTWLKSWAKATFGYVTVSLVLFLALSSFIQFPDRIQAYRKRVPAWESLLMLLFIGSGAMAHIHLVRNSMPQFTPGESDPYVLQAIQLASGNTSDLAPQPGYSYFLMETGKRLDWSMGEVTVIQAVLFGVALALLGMSMLRLMHAYAMGPVLLLAYMSPPALWSSLHIGVDSLLASLWLLALATFLYLWKREGWQRWIGWIIFGVLVSLAATVSFSGLLLLVIPLGLLFGTVVWAVVVRGKYFYKLGVLWSTLGQVALPVVLLVFTCLFLDLDKEAGMCSFPPMKASAPFTSGMFEVMALDGTPAYRDIITERATNGFRYDGPVMSAYPGLAEASCEALPLRALLVAWGRLSGWGLFLPDEETHEGESLLTDYTLRNSFRNGAAARGVQRSVSEIMRETGQLVQVTEKRSNRQVMVYNKTVSDIYRWFYRLLLFGGLAGWLIGLADRKFLAAVLVLPFMLNILLNVLLFNMSSQAIQSLDACLWLGALSGLLCVNARALQKPTDETDRRSLPPFRPKRLFTRHETLPGMPSR
ncbi:MAG: hypothetical protein ACO3ZW_06115 [Opitutales bacterium]